MLIKNQAGMAVNKVLISIFIGLCLVVGALFIFKNQHGEKEKMRIVLLGAPGAGKGTQAQYLSKKFNIPAISTGQLLRNEVKNGTSLGLKVQKIMKTGGLVNDDIVINLIKERIQQNDCKHGYLLDGFPRTLVQAESLIKENIPVNYVIDINVSDNDIVERLSGRHVHMASGRTYHVKFNPPNKPKTDNVTGEPLVQRDDDKKASILRRLEVYHKQTKPLVEYYKNLANVARKENEASLRYIKVDGNGTAEEVKERIAAAMQH